MNRMTFNLFQWVALCAALLLTSGCGTNPPAGGATAMTQPAVTRRTSAAIVFENLPDKQLKQVPADEISDYQRDLFKRFAASPSIDEVFSLEIEFVGWGGLKGTIEVAISGAGAELKYFEAENSRLREDRYFRRQLDKAEISNLRQFLAAQSVDHWQNQLMQASDGSEYEWMHLSGKGARRVILNNPRPDTGPECQLVAIMEQLRDAESLECVYNYKLPAGTCLLYANPRKKVRKIWTLNGDLRVLVDDDFRSEGDEWLAFDGKRWKACDPPSGKGGTTASRDNALSDQTGRRPYLIKEGLLFQLGAAATP